MRSMLSVGVVVALLFCSQPSLDACGDKFLLVGRGANFGQVYAAVYPGSIAIYVRNRTGTADRTRDLQRLLIRAGHRVSVVAAQDLAGTLLRSRIDLVIADGAESSTIDAQLSSLTAKPTALYVLMDKDKNRTDAGKTAHHLKQSDKALRWLQVIEDAMETRVQAGTRVKG